MTKKRKIKSEKGAKKKSSNPANNFFSSNRTGAAVQFSSPAEMQQRQRRSAPAPGGGGGTTNCAADRSQPIIVVDQQPPNRRRSQGGGNATTSLLASIFGGLARRGGEDQRVGAAGGEETADQLLAGVQALRTTSKMATKTAEAQRQGAKALGKWAERTNNNAMGDVVGWTSELLKLQADQQAIFAKDYEHFLKQLRKVGETEKGLKGKVEEVRRLVEEERRVGREFHRKGGAHEWRVRLDWVVGERKEAERRLANAKAEAEMVKMIQLGEGLKGLADAQQNLAKATQRIVACQRELVEFMPPTAPSTDIRQMRYEGVAHTRQLVNQLRRSLESGQVEMPTNAPSSVERRRRQRQSDPTAGHCGSGNCADNQQQMHLRRFHPRAPPPPSLIHPLTPPPPYTPTAPPMELVDGTPRRIMPRLHPNRHSTGATMFMAAHSSSSSMVAQPLPPASVVAPSNRIYPLLEPNPFAASLEARRQQANMV